MNLIRTAIDRPVTVSMFVVAVILFGIVSLDRLALNLLPEISYPSLTIQTDYEDAAPEEVENLITRPVEEAVGVIPGLTRLSSVSRSGQSEVVLEFSWGSKMDLAALEAREKLDVITLPREAKRPVILRFDPSNDPILRLQLSGDMTLSRLRYAAEKELKKALESTKGVAAIKVIGGLEEQIRIEIDEKRLSEMRIPIGEVVQVLAQENLNQASGSLYDRDSNYLVRILNEFRSVDEIRRIIIRDQDGRKIVLGDVARVWRGAKDREIIARLNGRESVEMAIYKEGDANTVTVARAVQQRLESLKKTSLYPKGVEYAVVFNQADFIEQAVDDVLSSAMIGGLLATLVLYVFLRDLRSTLTIGFTIPISIMATFALMYQTGLTLNLMSLGGVALGVGMLVDNAIVVLESVYRHRTEGVGLSEAVFRGTKEVGMAVTASTLTTVAVFLPLIFVEGIAGQLFRDQALTITYSLMASLLAAMTLIPMILALRMRGHMGEPEAAARPVEGRLARAQAMAQSALRFVFVDVITVVAGDIRRGLQAAGRLINRILAPALDPFESGYNRLSAKYPPLLDWAFEHKGSVFALTFGLLCLAGAAAFQLGVELIPPVTQGEFVFELRLPQGTPLPQTDRLLQDLQDEVRAIPGVKTVFSSAGGSNKNQFARETHEEHAGQLYVVMQNKGDRAAELATIDRIRQRLQKNPDLEFTVSRPTLFSFKTPIEVEVYSFDLDTLRHTADLVAARLQKIRGLSDVTTSTQQGSPEVQVRFDRDRLARLGLEESEISNVLRSKIRGDVASRYREADKQIEILVRADESDRSTIDNIRNLTVNRTRDNRQLAQTNNNNRDVRAGETQSPLEQAATAASAGIQSQRQQPSAPAPTGPTAAQQQNAGIAPIRLGSIADVIVDRGPSEVRRIRSQRAAIVAANVTGRDLGSVSSDIRAQLADLRQQLPGSVTLGLAGQNEELAASNESLKLALGLAIFLVYLVMASQFESLIHPFIILFTVPLGLIGVTLSLWVTQTPFSVMVFLGVIILAGIVVNNAIVLIDYANQLREHGYSRRDALRLAGEVRLRPILMTTLTTVLGLVPMAIGWGEGSEIRAPMAITVMGGLIFSTLLTLVFIPLVYDLVDRRGTVAATEPKPVGVAEYEAQG